MLDLPLVILTGADIRVGGTSTTRNRAGARGGIRLTFSMAAGVTGFATASAFVGRGASR